MVRIIKLDILKQKIIKLKIDNVCQGNLKQVYIRTFLVNRLLGTVVYLVTLYDLSIDKRIEIKGCPMFTNTP